MIIEWPMKMYEIKDERCVGRTDANHDVCNAEKRMQSYAMNM